MKFGGKSQTSDMEAAPTHDEPSIDLDLLTCGGTAAPMHIQTSGSSLSSLTPAPTLNIWPSSDPKRSLPASHRHTMMFIDSRPPRSGRSIARAFSMIATPGSRNSGVEHAQSGYFPRSHMAPPTVQPSDMTQPAIGHGDLLHTKPYGNLEISSLITDRMDCGQAMFGIDYDSAVVDLGQITYAPCDHAHDTFLESSRRMSESTNSISSYGPFADIPRFDDSSPLDDPQQEHEWSLLDSSTRSCLDPTSSPRPPSLNRNASRPRVSPAPSLRSSPYTLESTRNKRWSTGMYPTGQPTTFRPANVNRYSSYYDNQMMMPPQHAFSNLGPEPMRALPTQEYHLPSTHMRPQSSIFNPRFEPFPEISHPLPSQGKFRLLSSNTDRVTGCYSHMADLSDPPDLYASLSEQPADPPDEDLQVDDPDLVPREQELRFPGDLYTPKWVRGVGNKREGWCGMCKPGRWLVLKNSAFWYDKSFTHGVSAATGSPFQSPQDKRRIEGNPDIWEGLCGGCNDWVALVSNKKKGTTWFRHAYKCHTHPKVKDEPKRRRETAAANARALETSSNEPTITISASTPIASSELLGQESMGTREAEDETNDDERYPDIRTEDDSTPISTPQLSRSPMSTPHFGLVQTPVSTTQTSKERKRYSVLYDTSPSTQSFTARLEAFAEHETEHTSSYANEMTTLASTHSNLSFTFHNGTFTQSNTPVSLRTKASSTAYANLDEATRTDYTNRQTFTYQQHHYDLITPTTLQSQGFAASQPPNGNWI